jgi:hypothetical protein
MNRLSNVVTTYATFCVKTLLLTFLEFGECPPSELLKMVQALHEARLLERFGDCPVSGGFRGRIHGVWRKIEKQVKVSKILKKNRLSHYMFGNPGTKSFTLGRTADQACDNKTTN